MTAFDEWGNRWGTWTSNPYKGGDRDRSQARDRRWPDSPSSGSNVKIVDGQRPDTPPLTPTQWKITQVIDEIEELLISKNNAYGNSFAEPINIFSKAEALAQLDVRIDDKLNRIKKGHEYAGDDTELDLIGYLILKRVLRGL